MPKTPRSNRKQRKRTRKQQGGAHVNHKDEENGYTPLMLAIRALSDLSALSPRSANSVHINLFKYILSIPRLDVNAQDNGGKTALMHAISLDLINHVRLLINAGANINIRDNMGYTALIQACSKSYITKYTFTIIQLLLDIPEIEKYHMTNIGFNAFHYLVTHESSQYSTHLFESIRLLIDSGFDVNGVTGTDEQNTPLMLCAHKGLTESVRLLLNYPEININAQNTRGETALMQAVMQNHLNVARLLLGQEGIDVHLQNRDGKIVADFAKTPEMLLLLGKLYPNLLTVLRGSDNAISYMPIEEGNILVDFHNEARHGRYYKQNTFNSFPVPKQNPMTRKPILPANIRYYTAQLVDSLPEVVPEVVPSRKCKGAKCSIMGGRQRTRKIRT